MNLHPFHKKHAGYILVKFPMDRMISHDLEFSNHPYGHGKAHKNRGHFLLSSLDLDGVSESDGPSDTLLRPASSKVVFHYNHDTHNAETALLKLEKTQLNPRSELLLLQERVGYGNKGRK